MIILKSILPAVLFAAAVSIDSFAAGLTYGASKIRLPLKSACLIAAVCTLVTAAGLLCGTALSPVFPEKTARLFSCVILCVVALTRLFDGLIRSLLQRHPALSHEVDFSVHGLRFILRICADSTAADLDRSHTLSLKEAVFLAAALSLDGGAAGIGAGLHAPPLFLTAAFTFFFTAAALILGAFFGKRAARICRIDCGILAGGLLLLTALLNWL